MNIPELEAAIGRLKMKTPDTFDMSHYVCITPCHTSCCIAGDVMLAHGYIPASGVIYPASFFLPSNPDITQPFLAHERAEKILGLTPNQSEWLFNAMWIWDGSRRYIFMKEITIEQAIASIQALIETGGNTIKATEIMHERFFAGEEPYQPEEMEG